MNTSLLWIIFPGLAAVALFFLRRWHKAVSIAGTLLAAALAGMAWQLPIGKTLEIGPLSLEFTDTLNILGRRFILNASDRPILILVYLGVAFWFGASLIARTDRAFVPLGFGVSVLLTGALAVEPFLYAALLIEMAALVSVLLLASPGKPAGRGVLRFLTFQSLGMPFILFTGWLLAGAEASPGDSATILHAEIMMGLGFAFFLGVFPLHTWMPMLAEEAHPFASAFVFYVLPLVISLFGLSFLDRYAWLRASEGLYGVLRFTGALMVVIGGLWAAFQRHLGRMMGYAVMVEIGFSLLAIGSGLGPDGNLAMLDVFFALLLPRALSLGVWGLALSTLQFHIGDLRFRGVQGAARRLPVAASCLVLAHFSLAGLPLLAGFPARLALWEGLANHYPLVGLAALFGCIGLFTGGLRALAVLVMGPDEEGWHMMENWDQRLFLFIGGVAILLVGLFPQWFLPTMARMASLFVHGNP